MNITVIGAGIVGASIAYELASRGTRVRLVDARGVGRGATYASAGILAPYTEGHHPALLRLGACSLTLYDDFIRRVEADAGRRVEYARTGTLQVALSDAEAAALSSTAAALRDQQVECSLIDGAAVARMEPAISPDAIAGLVIPSQGYVAAPALTQAVFQAALARGALFTGARVEGVRAKGDRVDLIADGEVIACDAAIIAAGSWSSTLDDRGKGRRVVVPIRGQLLHLRADPRIATRIVWGTACYLVPWNNGTVLAGATVEDVGFDERSTAEGVAQLLAAAIRLVPALRNAQLAEVRAGLRPMIHDELPAIGRSSTMPHVFYATGHYRNGVLLAPLTASLVADLVLDGRERSELALVRPSRVGL